MCSISICLLVDQQQQQVEEFESRQKKMTSAISKQNDEICALKRDKESFRVKVSLFCV